MIDFNKVNSQRKLLIRQETQNDYKKVYELIKEAFTTAEQFGVTVPNGINSSNFMAIKLQEIAKPLNGNVIFAKEFGLSF